MLFVAFLSLHASSLVRTNYCIDAQVVRGRIILGEISKKEVRLNEASGSNRKKRSLNEITNVEMEESFEM